MHTIVSINGYLRKDEAVLPWVFGYGCISWVCWVGIRQRRLDPRRRNNVIVLDLYKRKLILSVGDIEGEVCRSGFADVEGPCSYLHTTYWNASVINSRIH